MMYVRSKMLGFLWAFCGGRVTSTGSCANRTWTVGTVGPIELTCTARDTRKPDGYSREVLTEMLWTVRKYEGAMGWKAPEPDDGT